MTPEQRANLTPAQVAYLAAEQPSDESPLILWAIDLGLVDRPTGGKGWAWAPHTELLRQGAQALTRLEASGNTETWRADFADGATVTFRRTWHWVEILVFTAHSIEEAYALRTWVRVMAFRVKEAV